MDEGPQGAGRAGEEGLRAGGVVPEVAAEAVEQEPADHRDRLKAGACNHSKCSVRPNGPLGPGACALGPRAPNSGSPLVCAWLATPRRLSPKYAGIIDVVVVTGRALGSIDRPAGHGAGRRCISILDEVRLFDRGVARPRRR